MGKLRVFIFSFLAGSIIIWLLIFGCAPNHNCNLIMVNAPRVLDVLIYGSGGNMYGLPHPTSLTRATLVELGQNRWEKIAELDPRYHSTRVKRELRIAGVTPYGLMKSESRYLPHVIHPQEHIGGVVYGRNEAGSAMLIATDRRVIFLDKKPLFINEDDLTYDVVSGVRFGHAGIGSTVTLHTRVKDYTIRTLNRRAAERFVQFIEMRCLEHTANGSFNK